MGELEEAKAKAAAAYNTAADHFDHPVSSFWHRFVRRAVERLGLPASGAAATRMGEKPRYPTCRGSYQTRLLRRLAEHANLVAIGIAEVSAISLSVAARTRRAFIRSAKRQSKGVNPFDILTESRIERDHNAVASL